MFDSLNRDGKVKAQSMYGHLEMVAFEETIVTAMVTHQICIPYLLVRSKYLAYVLKLVLVFLGCAQLWAIIK
jgi:hypothetical protein